MVHLLLTLLILLILLLTLGSPYVAVEVARARRARFAWSAAEAKRRFWSGLVALIALSLLPPLLEGIFEWKVGITVDLSHLALLQIPMIPSYGLVWAASAYQIAKAVFRRRDIEIGDHPP
jgi:hypothetical protein